MRRITWMVVLTLFTCALAGGGGPPGPLAPDFAFQTIDGQAVRLSALRGQAVIILFGDVHCAVCRDNDQLLRLYQYEYVDRDLTVISLHAHVTPLDLARYDAPFLFGVLTGRDPGAVIFREYHATLPTTVFIDRRGRVRNVVHGRLDESTLVRDLQGLL